MDPRLVTVLDGTRRRARQRNTEDWAVVERRLLDSLHPKQRWFVEDPAKRIAVLVPGRGGKTTAALTRLFLCMMRIPGALCLFVAVSRTHAEGLIWGKAKELAKRVGIETRPFETKGELIFLRNQSRLKITGADDKREIGKLRGIPRHEVIIDEAAEHRPKNLKLLIFDVLEPRLGDYDGSLALIGTPPSLFAGPFYDVVRPGSDVSRPYGQREDKKYEGWIGWSFHSWSLEDGAPYIPEIANAWKNALITKKRNGWSDDHPTWKREYLGLLARDDTESVFKYRPHLEDGRPWNQWDPEKDPKTGIAKLPEGHEWNFVYAMDLGHSDPLALGIFAYSLTEGMLRHVYEFTAKEMHTRRLAGLLLGEAFNAEKPGGLLGKTGWPAGFVADIAGLGGWILDELRDVYGIHVEAAEKKHKHDAIELSNGDFLDGRVLILKGSELETQLLSLQWAVDQHGMLKEDKGQRNDCTDYFVYARRKAHHLFAQDSPDPGPPPGSPEAKEAEMNAAIERIALEPDEFAEFLDGGDDFSDFVE